ncbi:putative uncharacterized protein C8orf44, partial [Plecturocebus cupreus]
MSPVAVTPALTAPLSSLNTRDRHESLPQAGSEKKSGFPWELPPLQRVAGYLKVEEPLRRNLRIGVAPKGHDLPQQDTKRPPAESEWTTHSILDACVGCEQWLMPIIPTIWEADVGRSFEVSSSRPVWPT